MIAKRDTSSILIGIFFSGLGKFPSILMLKISQWLWARFLLSLFFLFLSHIYLVFSVSQISWMFRAWNFFFWFSIFFDCSNYLLYLVFNAWHSLSYSLYRVDEACLWSSCLRNCSYNFQFQISQFSLVIFCFTVMPWIGSFVLFYFCVCLDFIN